MSDDEVVQYLIEEAVFERLAVEETRARSMSSLEEFAPAGPDPMQYARDFAAGKVG